jgi:protein transport protein DSL1/ZW10
VRRAEAPEVSGATIREAGDKVEFLKREAHYNRQVHAALCRIKHANELLEQIERTRDKRRILESLHLLKKASTAINQIPVSRSCRVMRILDMRASELKSTVHDAFDRAWNSLVWVDTVSGQVTICENIQSASLNRLPSV